MKKITLLLFVFFSFSYSQNLTRHDVVVRRTKFELKKAWVCFLNGYYIFNIVGFPIRKSTDQIVCANPRSLSQLITSFIASESQGIHLTLLISLL